MFEKKTTICIGLLTDQTSLKQFFLKKNLLRLGGVCITLDQNSFPKFELVLYVFLFASAQNGCLRF